MSAPEERWYAIFAGLRIGWVKGWYVLVSLLLPAQLKLEYRDRADPLTHGVSRARMRAFADEGSAMNAFLAAAGASATEVLAGGAASYDPVPAGCGHLTP